MDVTRAWAGARRALLDAVLPPLCLRCGEIVAESGSLCAACWPAFAFIAPPFCTCCGVPFGSDLGSEALCVDCLRRRPRFRTARAAMVYDAESKRLVLPFKHGDRTDMAKACGRWMSRAGAELLEEADLIAPVPLHWRRLFLRRYNQAALLARAVSRESGVALATDLLCRVRSTGSQAGLNGKERRRNVRLAFDLHPRWLGKCDGKAVVLIDDVLTTGATVEACAQALRQAGARCVDVLTLARVVRTAL
jgi:ComF family protein